MTEKKEVMRKKMIQKRNTRRALSFSIRVLFLCFAMLLGTTYAWFTDTVTNGVNRIVSGNLDVQLLRLDEPNGGTSAPDAFTEVLTDTPLFLNVEDKPILWEPGAGAKEHFRIVNNGTRALKYQFSIFFTNATKTADGKTLANILDITVFHMGGSFTDPTYKNLVDSAVVSKEGPGLEDCMVEGYLLPNEEIDFLVTLNWNPSGSDNEYNVEDGLSIDLGVTLLATQFTYEVDDEDDQYDKDATYPTVKAPAIAAERAELLESVADRTSETLGGAPAETGGRRRFAV